MSIAIRFSNKSFTFRRLPFCNQQISLELSIIMPAEKICVQCSKKSFKCETKGKMGEQMRYFSDVWSFVRCFDYFVCIEYCCASCTHTISRLFLFQMFERYVDFFLRSINIKPEPPPTTHLLQLHVQYVKPTADCIYHKLSVFVSIVSRLYTHLSLFFSHDAPSLRWRWRLRRLLLLFWHGTAHHSRAPTLKWFSSAIFHVILIW